MPGLKDRITDAAYGLGWSVVCRVPESWARGAFRFGANIAWRRQGPRVQLLEANLRRVLGPDATQQQLRAVSRESMESYARYWLEVFRLPVMPVERLVGGMRAEGPFDKAFADLANGRGVVFALPHMGNWDQAGAWIVAQGAGSVTAVMERLEPASVYDRFVAFREGLGMEVLPASGGARPFGTLAQRLRAGRVVVLVDDVDAAAIAHHIAVEPPLLAEDLREELVVHVIGDAVPLVVGGHDADGARFAQGLAERIKKRLAQHSQRYVGRRTVHARFRLPMSNKMF